MQVAELVIALSADMAQIKADMENVNTIVGSAMEGVNRSVNFAKDALIGLAGVGALMSVGGFANMIESTYKGAAALEDLSIQAGISGSALSGLVQVGQATGTSAEDIAQALNKMEKSLSASGDSSKGAGAALESLGLNFKDLKDLTPDEQMHTIAEAMNNFADGTGKSVAAMEIFGKSGAAMLAYYRDLGNAEELHAKFTDEQINQSKLFEQELRQLQGSGQAWKSELAMGMLPALQEAAEGTLKLVNSSGGLRDEIKKLTADGSIADWTRNGITALTYLMDAVSWAKNIFVTFGDVIGAVTSTIGSNFSHMAEFMVQVAHGQWGAALDTIKGGWEAQKSIVSSLGDDLTHTWGDDTLGQRLRARIKEVQDLGVSHEEAKDQVKQHAAAVAELDTELQKAIDAGIKFQESIKSMGDKLQLEVDQMAKLSKSQQENIDLTNKLANGTIYMTDAQERATRANIENNISLENQVKAFEEDIKANEAAADAQFKATDAIKDQTEKLKEHIETLGLTAQQIAELGVQRDLDKARILDAKVLWAEENMLGDQVTQGFRDQAKALRDLAALKDQGIHVQAALDAKKAWEDTTHSIATGLSGALVDAVASGKDIWTSFRNFMVQCVLDGMLKNAFASVINDGINAGLNYLLGTHFGTSATSNMINTVVGGASNSGLVSSAATGSTGSTAGNLITTAGSVPTIAGQVIAGNMSLSNAAGTLYGNATGTGLDGLLATNNAFGTGATTATGATSTTAATGATGATGATSGTVAGETAGTVGSSGTVGAIGTGGAIATFVVVGAKVFSGLFGDDHTPDVIETHSFDGADSGTIPRFAYDSNGKVIDNPAWIKANPDSLAATGHLATFADGGDFGGGIRMVGERGGELELTGPSRIFNADQTQQILSGAASQSGSNTAPSAEAMEALQVMKYLAMDVQFIKDFLRRLAPNGQSLQTTAGPA